MPPRTFIQHWENVEIPGTETQRNKVRKSGIEKFLVFLIIAVKKNSKKSPKGLHKRYTNI